MSYSKLQSLEEIRNKKIFFYDLETTGLVKTQRGLKPEEEYPDYKDLQQYDNARIVSIGWLYIKNFDYDHDYDNYYENISECIIKPDDFVIPNEAIKIHGITNEEVNKGKEIKKVLKYIGDMINDCDYIIGYNVYYDINVLLSELYRNNYDKIINKIVNLKKNEKIICIAQIASKEMKPDGWKPRINYQIPKQIDVYKKCFGEELVNAHNAKADVFAMIKIMYHIYKKFLEN